ncbi:hypothetical protein LEN26_011087 [Aphanomyces euteiches]|nr:hypothetical protein LEN26_011087 [Aphanomyces euteiches]
MKVAGFAAALAVVARSDTIGDWYTCNAATDSCASDGWVCCVAPADVSTGKTTCRPGGDECASSSGGSIPDWNNCQKGADTCASSGWVCCVAPADVSSGKTTCRPGGNECASPMVTPKTTPKVTPAPTTKQTPAPTTKSTPATTTKATPAPTGKGIPDWTPCQLGVDTCASSGWVCCVAPADLSSGKATCQPGGNECASTSTTCLRHRRAPELALLEPTVTFCILCPKVGAGAKGTSSSGVQDLESKQVGQYDDTILKQVDQLMLEAYQHNIKLIIALHDRWALGCWDSDAYVSKYNLPVTDCSKAVNRADAFYTNTNAQADIDRRLAHILQHQNPNFGNRAWGNIPEAILGFEPQNESQGWLHSWNNGQLVVPNPNWVCDRATKMRQNIPNKNILILSAVDVVSIHTYSDADSGVLNQFVSLANQYNKRVIVEEFGYTGNKASSFSSFTSTVQNAGLPWMMWEVLKPGNTGDYETWTDEGSAWQALAKGAANTNSKNGQWAWPELAARS